MYGTFFYIKISQIWRGNEKVSFSSHHPSITLLYQSFTNWQWKPVNEIKFSLPCKMNALYTLTQLEWNGRTNRCRLRVVPHFPSGIVERAKRECTWKSPNGEREIWGTTDKAFHSPAASRLFSRLVIFTRARASLALLSLRENEGLLVVYNFYSSTVTGSCWGDNTWGGGGGGGEDTRVIRVEVCSMLSATRNPFQTKIFDFSCLEHNDEIITKS